MQSILDPPIATVGRQHLLGREPLPRPGTEQPFGFDPGGFVLRTSGPGFAIDEPREPSGLLDGRKADLFGRRLEGDQTARFRSAAVEFIALDQLTVKSQKKKRAANARRAFAPFRPRRVGCP
jgi:hypothetical protein